MVGMGCCRLEGEPEQYRDAIADQRALTTKSGFCCTAEQPKAPYQTYQSFAPQQCPSDETIPSMTASFWVAIDYFMVPTPD
jgi:hypothetical protein